MAALRIGIVVGEASGDILGSSLIKAIKQKYPDAQFEGVGGPLMIAEGFNSHFPMDRLSVMGFVEPFKRLPELLNIRKSIKEYFTNNPPDLFVGIDSPDFTLNIELFLREAGILTAHYVSPSVWAWRQGRVKKIAKAVDRMLTLLPFEAEFYHQHNVPVTFVGHPLADQFAIDPNELEQQKQNVRELFNLLSSDSVVALMPGSRGGEVSLLAEPFIETARWCLHQRSDLKFIIPAANDQRKKQIQRQLQERGKGLPIQLVDGQSREVMTAADVILMASGTAALEAMLLKKPMVVAHRLSWFTHLIALMMVKIKFFSLPNILAGEALIPELLQKEVRPEMLGPLLLERLQDEQQRQQLTARFTELHEQLRQDASTRAAEVLLTMIEKRKQSSGIVNQ